jgi:RHS repeat-associated protein
VLNDGQNQYLYDAEGRICAVASTPMPGMTAMTGYLYDAAGTRVAKGSISTWSCDPAANGFQTTNDYILGLSGEQLTEMGVDTRAGSNASTLAWQHTNVWAGGKLLATYDADGLHFYLNDPLGTRRVQTDYAGVIEQSCVSLPYGDGLNCTGSTIAPTEHHFTGKERDAESGNDYFGARYYASSMGRWLSPDWSAKAEPVPYAKLDDPQTLNLYSYVRNNPMIRFDPDGHAGRDWCAGSGGGWRTLE